MKKYLTMICLLALTVAFSGCGNQGTERKIQEANDLITQAVNEGAELHAQIPLQKARESIDLAKQLLKENKTDSALTVSALAAEAAREALTTTRENNSIPHDGN